MREVQEADALEVLVPTLNIIETKNYKESRPGIEHKVQGDAGRSSDWFSTIVTIKAYALKSPGTIDSSSAGWSWSLWLGVYTKWRDYMQSCT